MGYNEGVTDLADPYFLRTERLGFRTWRPDDLELAQALWGDPQVTRYIHPDGRFSPEAVQARLKSEIACQAEHGMQYWPLFRLSDGDHVGCTGLRPYPEEEGVVELGFHIRVAHWRRGYGREAARAAIDYAFSRMGVPAVRTGHNPRNEGSQRLIAQLGFDYTHHAYYEPMREEHPWYLLKRPAEG